VKAGLWGGGGKYSNEDFKLLVEECKNQPDFNVSGGWDRRECAKGVLG
jgi:hypothetical protein